MDSLVEAANNVVDSPALTRGRASSDLSSTKEPSPTAAGAGAAATGRRKARKAHESLFELEWAPHLR